MTRRCRCSKIQTKIGNEIHQTGFIRTLYVRLTHWHRGGPAHPIYHLHFISGTSVLYVDGVGQKKMLVAKSITTATIDKRDCCVKDTNPSLSLVLVLVELKTEYSPMISTQKSK